MRATGSLETQDSSCVLPVPGGPYRGCRALRGLVFSGRPTGQVNGGQGPEGQPSNPRDILTALPKGRTALGPFGVIPQIIEGYGEMLRICWSGMPSNKGCIVMWNVAASSGNEE